MDSIISRLLQRNNIKPDKADIIFNGSSGWKVNIPQDKELQTVINEKIKQYENKRKRNII
jgi:hypothetical protein